jgi:hypothetical protein
MRQIRWKYRHLRTTIWLGQGLFFRPEKDRKEGLLLEGEYLEAKRLSERIAAEMEPPRFYRDRKEEIETSHRFFKGRPMVRAARKIIEEHADRFGHGLSHVLKVAVEGGAIVIIETKRMASEKVERMVLLAHLAGLLHDIKREEPEHARRGAEEANRILKAFDLEEEERLAIVEAINNHEAFKPVRPLDDPSLQLISDALYDADKFRWGPDNFTETVWMMVARTKVPISALLNRFNRGMRGIEKIKGTFRTLTGQKYGPDFICRGLEIGRRVYEELERIYGDRPKDPDRSCG